MKTFMAACRFWFAPLFMLPLIVLCIMQSNWLGLTASLVATFWAVAYTITGAMLDVSLRRVHEVLEFLTKLKE